MNKTDVQELIIYKQYLELIYYTEMITEKYPKVEKPALVTTIKNNTYEITYQVEGMVKKFFPYVGKFKIDGSRKVTNNYFAPVYSELLNI